MDDDRRPHTKNAPGPFYIVDGCCTACGVPLREAPELFEYDNRDHCFLRRQPETNDEVRRVVRAAWAAELECLRYRGNDPDILRRLAEINRSHLCDIPPPSDIAPVFRNHVTFEAANRESSDLTALDLAASFQTFLRAIDARRHTNDDRFKHMFSPVSAITNGISFAYSWFESNYHPIEFFDQKFDDARWLIRHSPVEKTGSRGVSNQLEEWLIADGRFRNFRWYSQADWAGSGRWQETVW